jgi:hypothetical protein
METVEGLERQCCLILRAALGNGTTDTYVTKCQVFAKPRASPYFRNKPKPQCIVPLENEILPKSPAVVLKAFI